MFVFFFKQKTAYEMRISDWSSDVCSSDLLGDFLAQVVLGGLLHLLQDARGDFLRGQLLAVAGRDPGIAVVVLGDLVGDQADVLLDFRSEEHTSELQSLMRISYAVFCLKKKININNKHKHNR